MQGLEQEIEGILELLQLEAKNCKKELANLPDGHLMCVNANDKAWTIRQNWCIVQLYGCLSYKGAYDIIIKK